MKYESLKPITVETGTDFTEREGQLETEIELSPGETAKLIAPYLSQWFAPIVEPEEELPAYIETHHDLVPNVGHPDFAPYRIVSSRKSGEWNDPSVWSTGEVPLPMDSVRVNHLISHRGSSESYAIAVYPGGELNVTDGSRLMTGTLQVHVDGSFVCGIEGKPIANGAVIVFNPVELDAGQFCCGVLALGGDFTVHGRPLNRTWARLFHIPKAGDTELVFQNDVSDWGAGDRIALADSRQIMPRFVNNWNKYKGVLSGHPYWHEVLTVADVVENRVKLSDAVQYDHPGSYDGLYFPSASNLSRSVCFMSADADDRPVRTGRLPASTRRAHALFTGRCDVDLRFASWINMGRTQNRANALDNLPGRYSLHMHHCLGKTHPFHIEGCCVDGFLKWGLVVHGSSYGTVHQNVIHRGQGTGIIEEDGSSVGVKITDNHVGNVLGTTVDGVVEGELAARDQRYGLGGVGIWTRTALNHVTGNVVAGCFWGIVQTFYYGNDKVQIAHEPLAMPGAWTIYDAPLGRFEGNEVYGLCAKGIWMAWHSSMKLAEMTEVYPVQGCRVWNFHEEGFVAYHARNIHLYDSDFIADERAFLPEHMGKADRTPPICIKLDQYELLDFKMRNVRAEGGVVGLVPPSVTGFSGPEFNDVPALIEECRFRNHTNVLIIVDGKQGRQVDLKDNEYERIEANTPLQEYTQYPHDLAMAFDVRRVDTSLFVPYIIRLYNYDGIEMGYVYFLESASSAIVPMIPNLSVVSAVEEGLTNEQYLAKYGFCIAGKIAPCDTQHPRILGFVC